MVLHDNAGHEYISAHKAVLILVAAALNMLELFIPRIPLFPWLKPGLANSITIIWIIRYGTVDALLFSIIRIWITSFYFGFSLVTTSLALSGSLCATMMMGCLWHIGRKTGKYPGTVSIAIIGALFHNLGQLATVCILLTHNPVIFYQLPFMGLASLLFGTFTGCITPLFWRILSVSGISTSAILPVHRSSVHPSNSMRKNIGAAVGIAGAMSILAVSEHRLLIIIASAITLLVLSTGPRKFATLFHPLRFWFLFVVIAAADLFFSYGIRIPYLPFLTYEGLSIAATHSLRLWIWIQISLILHRLQCNRLLFSLLETCFPRRGTVLAAGVFALEFFPDVLLYVKSSESRKGLPWHRPYTALSRFINRVCVYILDQIERESENNHNPGQNENPMLKDITSPPR